MNSTAPIVLVGLRCVGKSTVGPLLARELGVGFVDLDDALAFAVQTDCCASHSPSLADWIAAHGWPAFRQREAQELERVLSDGECRVVAAGGGVVEREENRARLVASARVVWLREELQLLVARAQSERDSRPALTDLSLAEEFEHIAARRAPLYAAIATLTVDAGRRPARELAREIAARITTARSSSPAQP